MSFKEMIYELDESDSSFLSSEGTGPESTDVSRIIDEEDIIGSVFSLCDESNRGLVPTSQIIEYIQMTTNSEQEDERMSDLRHRLDPEGVDVEVDLKKAQRVLSEWILTVQQETDTYSSEDVFSQTTPLALPPNRMSQSSNTSFESYDTTSVVEDLRFQNRKLAEECSTLRSQLDVTEETVAQRTNHIDDLKKQLKDYVILSERHRDLQEENGELKNSLLQLEESRQELHARLKKSNRDAEALEHEVMSLHKQVSECQSEVEHINRKKAEADEILREYRESSLMERGARVELETNLQRREHELAENQQHLEESFRNIERLRTENAGLEIQLAQSQRDQSEQMFADSLAEVPQGGTLHKFDVSDDDLMPVKLPAGHDFTSTPSLCSELKTSILCDDLPVPLMSKEYDDMLFKPSSPNGVPNIKDIETLLYNITAAAALSPEQSGSQTSCMKLLDFASPINASSPALPPAPMQSKHQPPTPLHNKQMELEKQARLKAHYLKFSENIAELLSKLKHTEARSEKLARRVQELEVENADLGEHVEAERKQVHQLNNQVVASESQLRLSEHEMQLISMQVETLQEQKESLESHVQSLTSINGELSDKYEKVEGHMDDLRHELDEKSKESTSLKKKSLDLQEELSSAQKSHKMELKGLWKLVQNNQEESDCSDLDGDSQASDITISQTSSVREQVAKEIESLRSQLERSQKALAVLSRNVPGSLDLDQLSRNGRESPSSPLLEALTLGTYLDNKAKNKARDKNTYRQHSADSLLDDNEFAHLGEAERDEETQKLFATSCPQLETRSCLRSDYSRSRAPPIGGTRYTIVNTSTGSSTSGAVDLDFSSSSNRSEPHGIFRPRKSVLIVETGPETPSSPEDDSRNHFRNGSFKRAIERGASGDSSQHSFDTVDPPSTSPDLSPEHGDLPPYPLPPHHAPAAQRQYPDNTLYPYEPYDHVTGHVTHSASKLSDLSTAATELSWIDQPSSDYLLGGGDNDGLRTSTPDCLLELPSAEGHVTKTVAPVAADGTATAPVTADPKLSPHTTRRLSTLEEESDIEEGRGSTSGSRGSTSGSRRSAQGHYLSPCNSEEMRPKTPPGYKQPPAYDGRSRSPSGREIPPVTPPYIHPPPAPSRSPQPSPSPTPTATPTPTVGATLTPTPTPFVQVHTEIPRSPQAQFHHIFPATKPASPDPKSPKPAATKVTTQSPSSSKSSIITDAKKSPKPRHSPTPSPRSAHKDLTVKDSSKVKGEGSTEEDKPVSAQPAEEPKKVSAAAKNRGRFGRSRKGSSQDLIRSQTFDEGDDDEVFRKDDTLNANNSVATPNKSGADSQHKSMDVNKHGDVNKSVDVNKNGARARLDSTGKAGSDSPGNPRSDSPARSQCTQTSPSSPPAAAKKDSDGEVSLTTAAGPQTPSPAHNANINKIKQNNLARKRSLTKQVKLVMPDVVDVDPSAAQAQAQPSEPSEANGAVAPSNGVAEVLDEDNVSARAFPNLPDEALEKLGLLRKKGDQNDSGDHLTTEQDIEEKYASISLAFKTDKLTLDQRIDLHERARDRAEQNIDSELDNLKKAMQVLSPFCTDAQSREVFTKIQHHLDVLETSTSRVSSRAEIHGAVQQELRLSKAVEVMMQHVENLKHLYEKEHAELEETRKILQENKLQGQEGESPGIKRYSLAGVSSTKLGGKRRASVAVFARRQSMLSQANSSSLESLDARSRFQSAVANASAAGASSSAFRLRSGSGSSHDPHLTPATPATPALRPARPSSGSLGSPVLVRRAPGLESNPSIDSTSSVDSLSVHESRSNSLTTPVLEVTDEEGAVTSPESNNNHKTPPLSHPSSAVSPGSPTNPSPTAGSSPTAGKLPAVKNYDEDLAYQRGFEEGVRAQVSHHLAELNEQQRDISEALESLMEHNDTEDAPSSCATDSLLHRFRDALPAWEYDGRHLRYTVAGCVFFMALLSMLITLLPRSSAESNNARNVDWENIELLLAPYVSSLRSGLPPF